MANFSAKSAKFIGTYCIDDCPINILEGSVRSSKTWTMIPKLLFRLLPHKVAGDRVIFGVSKETIYNNVLTEVFNFVGTRNYSYNRQSGELWLKGQRWSVVGAKDEGSEKYIRGRTVGLAYGDELALIPKSFFEMMTSRMSPEGARLYGTTNPDSPYHYLYTDYISDKKKIARGTVKSIKFVLDDNLSLSEEKKQYYRELYKGVFKKRMIDGLWVMADGAIYKDSIEFEEEDDKLGANEYNDSTRPLGLLLRTTLKFVPIDYGTGNPTVFLLVIDDGTTYWVEREYYWDSDPDVGTGIQKTDKQYATDLKEFLATYAPEAQCIVDPSAASFKAEMVQNGIWHRNGKNDVLPGIRTVSSLLGQRKIKIHKRCVQLRKELQTYAWDKNAAKKGEDAPLKQHDHAPDALRYFCETMVPKWRISA